MTEFRHLTGQNSTGSTWCTEFPSREGEPFYPIPTSDSAVLYKKYEDMTYDISTRVLFIGRLAQYKYYNMDQVVASALTSVKRLL